MLETIPTGRRISGLMGAAAIIVLVAACGATGGGADATSGSGATTAPGAGATAAGGGGGGSSFEEDPCGLATAAMVAAAFGGTSTDGEPGGARNCVYTLTGGLTPTISVFYYGDASGWDGVRSGFENNREGTTDLSGIGEAAFYPNDAGPTELIVRAGGHIFSVSGGFGGTDEVNAGVSILAIAITSQL